MQENNRKQLSIGHAVLSFLIPGAGQVFAKSWGRGIGLLIAFLSLGWLSIWTIAERARFPDMELATDIFIPLFLQSLALLIFLVALVYLFERFLVKDPGQRAYLLPGMGLLYLIVLYFAQESILDMAGATDNLVYVHAGTGLFAAAALAAFHLWQVRDAGKIGATDSKPSLMPGILLACVVIFIVGWRITGINLPKAISEYRDTQIILRRIAWPWRSAFEYEFVAIETTAKVQAPCPDGAAGPAVNEPDPDDAWIRVTPTCGDVTVRDLATGGLTFGTELTIYGDNFRPGAEVTILWRNPIGNPFTPRGVGETRITIQPDGSFESKLYVPEMIIPSTAAGDQIHTLVVRQESGEVFTGNLSGEMKLALRGLLETIMIGLVATFFGVILSFPLSFLAARNIMAPIVAQFQEMVGGLVGLLIGLRLLAVLMGQVSAQLGGLEQSPLPIAGVGLVLLIVVGLLSYRLGAFLFGTAFKRIPNAGRGITALSLGLLSAGAGYFIGLGFSRGIVAIPIGADVAELFELYYAWGGAVLIGLGGMAFGWLWTGKAFGLGMIVYAISRTVMNIVRSIEPIIWAIIGTIWVGLGPFAGTIALTLHTIAALGKLYSEAIESIDHGPIEALQATGANRLQTIIYAVVPQIMPPFISFTIYRWDINVRMSTIIGMVGGGGIGFILIQWIRLFQYESAGIAVWLITITVAVLDYISSSIRERFV